MGSIKRSTMLWDTFIILNKTSVDITIYFFLSFSDEKIWVNYREHQDRLIIFYKILLQ